LRNALRPVWFILKTAMLLAIAAYPVTMVAQWFSKESKLFSIYNEFILNFAGTYWDWIIVVLFTYFLTRPGDKVIKTCDDIKNRQYELETLRWMDTPYIAPLHLYYLLAPPIARSNDAKDQALDPFYKKIVSDFRDRVYVNAKYTRMDPLNAPTRSGLLGQSLITQLIVNTFVFLITIAGMLYFPFTNSLFGWSKCSIPVAAYFLSLNLNIVKAYITVDPRKTYKMVKQHFDDEDNPKITWRDVFPDRPYGEAILFAWKADCERRQRFAYEASGRPVPAIMEYTSPGLAPKPFPSEKIPTWADGAEQAFFMKTDIFKQQKYEKSKAIAANSKGKVVVFPQRY